MKPMMIFSSIGMTNRTLDEEMKRYFFTLNLYGSDFDMTKEIIEVAEKVTKKPVYKKKTSTKKVTTISKKTTKK